MKKSLLIVATALAALLLRSAPARAQVPPDFGALLCATLGVGCPSTFYSKDCGPPQDGSYCYCNPGDIATGGGGGCNSPGALSVSRPAFGGWQVFCDSGAPVVVYVNCVHQP